MSLPVSTAHLGHETNDDDDDDDDLIAAQE